MTFCDLVQAWNRDGVRTSLGQVADGTIGLRSAYITPPAVKLGTILIWTTVTVLVTPDFAIPHILNISGFPTGCLPNANETSGVFANVCTRLRLASACLVFLSACPHRALPVPRCDRFTPSLSARTQHTMPSKSRGLRTSTGW
jgi:hypothetical protein